LLFVQRTIIQKVRPGWKFNKNEVIIALFFTLVNLCYQTIGNLSFGMLSCKILEDGFSYLNYDLDIKCWESRNYLTKNLIIAAFFISFVIIGFPILILIKLFRKRNQLSSNLVFIKYGVFFIGFKDEFFYWEIVV
jgi:hypothetical protein